MSAATASTGQAAGDEHHGVKPAVAGRASGSSGTPPCSQPTWPTTTALPGTGAAGSRRR